jgi:hypothetical protein
MKFIIITLFLFYPTFLFCQEVRVSEFIITTAEQLAADDSDQEAVQFYTERLYELAENPVNLNSSSGNEIAELFFLSDFQVKALEDYKRTYGIIVSVYELSFIPGFDNETVEMMIPFIVLENKMNTRADSARWRNTLLTNLAVKPGNSDTSSLGSQWRVLTKYKFTAGSVAGGLTAEKDPGEKLLDGTPPLPDFLSAHIAYTGKGIIRKIIAGDYSARFGQGTAVNTGFRTALSATAPDYMAARDEIRPYTSTDENNFFRGVASELNVKNMGINLFYSKKYSDASTGSATGSSDNYITNFYRSGLHNTSSSLQKKNTVAETAAGAGISFNLNNIRMGLLWINSRLSLPVKSESNDIGKILDFQGNRNNIYSAYYNSLINRVLIYGEFSLNDKNKYAFVQGVKLRPADRLTVNILYRNYDAGYASLHGRGPGDNSFTGNEHGIVANITFEAARHLFISAGCDIYSYPWLKYRCNAPTHGKKQEIRMRYLPGENMSLEASYNQRISMTDSTSDKGIPGQNILTTRWLKMSAAYRATENLNIKTRIDLKASDQEGSFGMLLLQDLSYRFRSVPLSFWARFCIFNINDWDVRIYTYENDLLYGFSVPALSGTGNRSYIMAKWEVSDFVEFRVKYGITYLVNNGEVPENKDEVKVQFRVWF